MPLFSFFTKRALAVLAVIICLIIGSASFFSPPFSAQADSISTATSGLPVTLEVTCPAGGCGVQGCTNSSASNYNPSATVDDGSCAGGGGSDTPPPTTPGCTDSFASNYNPAATVNDNSCLYAIPNVSNLTAVYGAGRVTLSWQNPSFPLFAGVVVVKSDHGIPISPTDGELIYEGSAQSLPDPDVVAGRTYFYTVFVKNTIGNYSSGALTFASIPVPLPTGTSTPPGGTTTPPGGGSPPGGGPPSVGGGGIILTPSLSGDPFASLPQVVTPTNSQIQSLNIGDFIVSQAGEPTKRLAPGGVVNIRGDREWTISIPYDKVPEVLKTIGVTVFDPTDHRKSFSFLLTVNATKTAYQATIAPFGKDGLFPISVYVINYNDQTIKKFNSQLIVAGTVLSRIPLGTIEKVAAPLVVTGGVAIGLSQLLLATSPSASLADLYFLFLRQFAALLGYFGLRKKRQPWGTVYDAITKQPIDPAYVSVLRAGKEVSTAITDIDGRYGFFLPWGEYELAAKKTHYQFPSETLRGKTADQLYDNLYFGQPIRTGGEEVVNLNIPLDPIGFDWNEFAKSKQNYFKVFSNHSLWRARLGNALYAAGFAAALGYVLFTPSWLNIAVLLLYVAISLFKTYWHYHHKVLALTWAGSGEPLPFAVIRIFLVEPKQEIKKVITDGFGRFFVLVRPGVYYLTVEEKQADASYRLVYQSEPLTLKRGVLSDNIVIPRVDVPPPAPLVTPVSSPSPTIPPINLGSAEAVSSPVSPSSESVQSTTPASNLVISATTPEATVVPSTTITPTATPSPEVTPPTTP